MQDEHEEDREPEQERTLPQTQKNWP
jgi:hypothetical protein